MLDPSKLTLEFRPWRRRWRIRTIVDCAVQWLLRVDYIDEDNRAIGLDYEFIRNQIITQFPVVKYPGPYYGRPTVMRFKELYELTRSLNQANVRLPVRYRKKTRERK